MLEVAELLEEARKRSALDDFGDDAFREGLDEFVESLDAEGEIPAAVRERYGFYIQRFGVLIER